MSTWDDVQASIAVNRCRCELREGMTRAQLQPLGAGCTGPLYACPALDKYRRLLPATPLEADPEAAPAPAAQEAAPIATFDPFASQFRGGA